MLIQNLLRTTQVKKEQSSWTLPDVDPNYVKLLLHGDGTDGATSIVDSSLNPKSITNLGGTGVKTSSTKFVFGNSSLQFPGNAYIRTLNNSDMNFKSYDFTIDFWINSSSTATLAPIFTKGYHYLYTCPILINWNNGVVNFLSGAIDFNIWAVNISTTTMAKGSWNHVAITRKGNIWRIFLNGYQTASANVAFNVPDLSSIYMGSDPSGVYRFTGYLEEFRVVNGICVWDTNFTVPDKAYRSS